MRSGLDGLTLLSVGLGLACATPAAPELQMGAALPASLEPTVFLVAARQKQRIRHSLAEAGIGLTDDLVAAPFLLRVTVGIERGSRECGTFNNVKYSLRRGGVELLLIRAAGWTGDCQPNVLDEMSAALASALSDAGHPEGGS